MHDIRTELLEINEKIKDLTPSQILQSSDKNLYHLFRRLDEIVAMEIGEEEIKSLERDETFQKIVKNIATFRRWYGLKLELKQAHFLLRDKDPWKRIKEFVFYPNYVKLAEMEFYGASLKRGDAVVFIGSGPLPMSLIMLASLWGIKGIGIEREKEYANLSTALISHLGLSRNIEIKRGDHYLVPSLDLNISLYMVASAAYPKEEIFSFLGRSLAKESKVSYRTYDKGLRRLFCDTEVIIPSQFEELIRIQPIPPVNNTVVILRKK